jgi:hypothetical protein
MRSMLSLLARLYRLGFCGALVGIDALLVLVFLADFIKFAFDGYGTASLQTAPAGSDLIHALLHAAVTAIFMLLVLPLLVTSVRVLVTRLKMPSIDWPPRRVLTVHILLTILVAVGIVACVRMEVASGLRFGFDATKNAYVSKSYFYNSNLEYLPLSLSELLTQWLPGYVKSWHFLFLIFGLAFSYFTGRRILENQRCFLNEYVAASKLADCDPSYLPMRTGARRVPPVRSCSPHSDAVQAAINHERDAVTFGQNGASYGQSNLAKRGREMVASYLFKEPHPDLKIRVLPDTLSCIYSAITNEDADTPIVLSSANHSGINEPITAWCGRNRKVQVLGVDETHRLDDWAAQQSVFLLAFKETVASQANVLIVLPLVSFWTGQVFDLRTLIQQIRTWSKNAVVVLDGSFLNVGSDTNLDDLYGADYLCLNISQWITCSEPCGVLLSKKWLSFDPDWDKQVAFVPTNTRTVSAFCCALQHSFHRSMYFNDPKSRTEILIQKFRDAVDPRFVSVVEIPGLTDRTYFLTVEPARGKKWEPQFPDKIERMGLSSTQWRSGSTARLTVAFPPYVDFWQVKRLAGLLTDSVE